MFKFNNGFLNNNSKHTSQSLTTQFHYQPHFWLAQHQKSLSSWTYHGDLHAHIHQATSHQTSHSEGHHYNDAQNDMQGDYQGMQLSLPERYCHWSPFSKSLGPTMILDDCCTEMMIVTHLCFQEHIKTLWFPFCSPTLVWQPHVIAETKHICCVDTRNWLTTGNPFEMLNSINLHLSCHNNPPSCVHD